MEDSQSNDFASVIFTFIRNENDKFHLQFFNRGMFFPIVVRKYQNNPLDVYDLNIEEKGWYPQKGYLLSAEIRKLMEERYEVYPSCSFTIYEGDCILYFSDGIIEAQRKETPHDEYGMERMKNILIKIFTVIPRV
jgi:hypothetical protein